MNYLAHVEVARRYCEQFPEHDNSNFYAGVAGPDRISIAGCRLLRLKTWGQRVHLSDEQIEIQNGVDFHIATDVTVGEHREYLDLRRVFRDEIVPDFISPEYRGKGMLADFGTDMLIDGYVMENLPGAAQTYCESIVDVDDFVLCSISRQRLQFLESVNRTRGKVPDYSSPQIIAQILQWRTSRNPMLSIASTSIYRLGLALSFHKENVYEVAEKIIDDVSAAMTPDVVD